MTWPVDMSPSSGSPTMGSMEVMGRGRASVIQYLSEMLSSHYSHAVHYFFRYGEVPGWFYALAD